MKSREKIRIIRNWCRWFKINAPVDKGYHGGYWYGNIMYYRCGLNAGPGHHYLGPYTTDTSVVDEAYELVQGMVWDIVVQCGK